MSTLWYGLVGAPSGHLTHGCSRQPKLLADGVLRAARSDFGANVRGPLGSDRWPALPCSAHGPALRLHVGQVLGVRSEPQMRRVAADRIVAGMADHFSCRDLPECEHPSKSVCPDRPIAAPEDAVAMRHRGRPCPASVRPARAVYLCPEPFVFRYPLAPVRVAANEAHGFSAHPPKSLARLSGQTCFLAASTLAFSHGANYIILGR